LSGNANIHNEAHDVGLARNILFFLKNAEFVCSVDKDQLFSDEDAIFGQGGSRKYKIIKFRFVLKLPSIRINQKCSMGVESL